MNTVIMDKMKKVCSGAIYRATKGGAK